MASRSDQLHSHQFTLQRVVGALAMRDPDPVSSPLRRIGGALLASVMVAALGVAAVGVYGVLRPGGDDSWRDGNAVIIETETGARFVYRDGVLYPVVNYSSALLILSSAQPRRAYVPRASLVGVARGTPLGIPGAPDLLPAAGDLVTTPWTLCSRPPTLSAFAGSDQRGSAAPATMPPGSAASARAESVLLVGSTPGGGVDKLGGRALVASDPAGGLHMIWQNRRYAITHPDLVLAAFAWPRQAATPVSPAVLNAVPAGPDVGRVPVERRNQPSVVEGFRIGQVFVVENQSGGRQFGVALAAGLAEITPAQADLLIADGANGPGGKPKQLGQAQYASAPRAASLVPTGEVVPPATAPQVVSAGASGGVCATFATGAPTPEVALTTPVPRDAGEVRTSRAPADVAATVDWVAVPPGRGAVVEALAGPGSPNGALAVVSDLGLRFPVPSREVLGVLGYPDAAPQRLPAALIALLPSGRALDPASAALPATPAA